VTQQLLFTVQRKPV